MYIFVNVMAVEKCVAACMFPFYCSPCIGKNRLAPSQSSLICSRVEWFVILFLAIFAKWTHCCCSPAFKFSFSKNHRDLKNEYFSIIRKFLPLTSKNTRQKEKKEKNTFVLGFPKMDKTIFDLDKEQQIEFLFTFVSFLKKQKTISPGAGFKYA